MGKKKKKLKFRKRRSICSEDFHPRKEADLMQRRIKFSLEEKFPDPEERLQYIKALYDKLGED